MTPRERRRYEVFAFSTTHDALEAEEALGAAGVACVPIPTPKSAGGLCGIALRVLPEHATAASGVIQSAGVAIAARVAIEDV